MRIEAMFCCEPASITVVTSHPHGPYVRPVARVAPIPVLEAILGDVMSVNQHIEASSTSMMRQLAIHVRYRETLTRVHSKCALRHVDTAALRGHADRVTQDVRTAITLTIGHADTARVGCAQLRGRDIEGFAHVLLERLQTTRKRTQGGASAASKPSAVGTATPITDGGVEEGAVDASSETGDEETSSLLLASSQDRMAAVRLARGSIATCTGGPARASNRTSYRTSFAAAPALRTSYRSRAYSSRLRQATKRPTTSP